MKKYNDEEMAKLISEVETEFKDYLAKAEQSQEDLNKSEEDVSVEAKSEETEEVVEQELNKSEETKEFDYDEEDIKEMNELYASMTKAEAEAHYKAIKSTLFTEESEEKSEDLNKSEEKEEETETLLKSEVESVKKENEELKKNLETLTSIISKVVKSAPKRKAVTQIGDIQYIKKSEDTETKEETKVDYSKLPKAEINKVLSSKIRSGEIKKSEDKDNINKFCFGELKFDDIKYLL